MASGAVALGLPRGPGAAAAVMLAALCLGPIVVLAVRGVPGLDAAAWSAVRFTLGQAAVSAVLSVALAVPVARALARRRFAGRAVLVTLLGVPFLLPVIVAVLGLLAVFGQAGVVNAALAALGLPGFRPYGPAGVVLAHVFLNLPLAVRMILHGWQAIPAERFRLAASLGLGSAQIAWHLERPMLRAVLPGAALAIFLICLTSFAVALILGGGPRATTVELAIYQAIRFDFDLGRAAALALVQAGLCAGAVVGAGRLVAPTGFGTGRGRVVHRFDAARWPLRVQDGAVIALAAAFLIAPLAGVVLRGLGGLVDLPGPVWAAAVRSLCIAPVSAAMAVVGALGLVVLILREGVAARLAEVVAMLPLVASGLVLGAGLFLGLLPLVAPDRVALPVTAVVNAAMALPFAVRLLLPSAREIVAQEAPLARALGVGGWDFTRLILIPRLRRPLGFAAGVAAALAMGDLGVIALFATDSATLPLQVMRLMGAFRTADAEAAALLLVLVSLGLFVLADLWGRGGNARA